MSALAGNCGSVLSSAGPKAQRFSHCSLELLLSVFLWPGLVTRSKFGKPLEPGVQSNLANKVNRRDFSDGILLQTLFVKIARFLSSFEIDLGLTAILSAGRRFKSSVFLFHGFFFLRTLNRL